MEQTDFEVTVYLDRWENGCELGTILLLEVPIEGMEVSVPDKETEKVSQFEIKGFWQNNTAPNSALRFTAVVRKV